MTNKHTDRHTHTHIRTFRLIESIGPEGRCFENIMRTSFNISPDMKEYHTYYLQIQKGNGERAFGHKEDCIANIFKDYFLEIHLFLAILQ